MTLRKEVNGIRTTNEEYDRSIKRIDEKYAHLKVEKKRDEAIGVSKESGDFSKKVTKEKETAVGGEPKEKTTSEKREGVFDSTEIPVVKEIIDTKDTLKVKIESYDKTIYIQEWILQVDELIKRRVINDKDQKLLIYAHLPQDLKR